MDDHSIEIGLTKIVTLCSVFCRHPRVPEQLLQKMLAILRCSMRTHRPNLTEPLGETHATPVGTGNAIAKQLQ